MVDEHLPEVLPPDIKELCDDQGPVEGQLHHVVQPDVLVHLENENEKIKTLYCALALLPHGKDIHTNSIAYSTATACQVGS